MRRSRGRKAENQAQAQAQARSLRCSLPQTAQPRPGTPGHVDALRGFVPGCVIGKLGLLKKGSRVLLDRLERQTDELIEQH
jgi:hypothetical protein